MLDSFMARLMVPRLPAFDWLEKEGQLVIGTEQDDDLSEPLKLPLLGNNSIEPFLNITGK